MQSEQQVKDLKHWLETEKGKISPGSDHYTNLKAYVRILEWVLEEKEDDQTS